MKQGNRNGTQVHKPINNPKKKNQPPKVQPKAKIPLKGGVRIGENKDKDKWRCKTCKFLNDVQQEICTTCEDPRYGKKKQQQII